MNKEQRLAKKQREDQALNRVLWWFGGTVALEFFLLLLNRFFLNFDADGVALARGLFLFLRIFAPVCLAAAAACGAWWFLWHKGGRKTFAPGVCCLVFAALALCSFVIVLWKELGIRFLYVCVPVAAVLALIYYLYQREFFLLAIEGGLALFALWSYRTLTTVSIRLVYGIFLAVALLTAAGVVLFVVLQQKKGRLGKVRLLSKSANYLPLYLGAAVTAAVLVVTLLLGSTAAYVSILAVVAWLFAAAVYYTVRLM